jgi:hypothetical protein
LEAVVANAELEVAPEEAVLPAVSREYNCEQMGGTPMAVNGEVAILSRIIDPDKSALPTALARQILKWEFPENDRRRMESLLEKAKVGRLNRIEREEAEDYERVGHLISIFKSKARTSLRSRREA